MPILQVEPSSGEKQTPDAEPNTAMRNILIYDTTLRDGTQGEGVSLSLQDKLNVAARLAEFGIDMIEGGYPLSNEKDVQFFQRVRELKLGKTKIASFGMTRRRGVAAQDDPGMRALVAAKSDVITVVGKSWDYQATEILNVSLDENIAMIAESVGFLSQHAEVVYDAEHFFDGYKANPDYALKAIYNAASAGASWVALCDTNGGTLPEDISKIVAAAKAKLAGLNVKLGIHCHNDGDLATANSLAAVDAGCDQIQGTINGVGERCGNADLIALMANLSFKKKGYQINCGQALQHLTELSRFVYETANLQLRNSQPYVGQSAFAHKGGMHVHAINKAAWTYEHLNPELVGNARRILVSELSGRSNIAAVTKGAVANDREMQDKILAAVVQAENAGYQFEAAEASFQLLVERSTESFSPHFKVIKYRVDAGDASAGAYAEASLQLEVDGESRFEGAQGHGPVNALDAALRKALRDFYPNLESMRLVDYKVRVVDSDAGTAAKIRVNIESADDGSTWRTIGVSENIIEASWLALIDAIEYKLHKDHGKI
jgi:2-isopropylmalate synthase